MAMKKGLPGLQRLDHVGITVPDLEEATRFFIDVLGCEYMYTLGPFQSEENWMKEHLNVDPRAIMKELHFFRLNGVATFEVFEYSAPVQNPKAPKNSDVGGHHVALYVDDMNAALAHLKAHNVEIQGEPTTSKGPSEGQHWVYFLSPWGMQFELVSYPNGKAFDHHPEKFVKKVSE